MELNDYLKDGMSTEENATQTDQTAGHLDHCHGAIKTIAFYQMRLSGIVILGILSFTRIIVKPLIAFDEQDDGRGQAEHEAEVNGDQQEEELSIVVPLAFQVRFYIERERRSCCGQLYMGQPVHVYYYT